MTLMNKPIGQIKLEDVEELKSIKCPEGASIDYKEDVQHVEKIAKLASAFANGQGGTVIIGVKETKLPNGAGIIVGIPGVENAGALEERIKGSCLSHITPPVIPEFQVIQLPKANPNDIQKELLIVRASESELAPHQFSDGAIYVRFWDRAHYDKDVLPATFKEIGWLLNKRAKATENKSMLLERANRRARFDNLKTGPIDLTVLELSIIPIFPVKRLFSQTDLTSIYKASSFVSPHLVIRGARDYVTANESLCCNFENILDRKCYFEANTYGLHYLASPVLAVGKGDNVINGSYCFALLLSILHLANANYRAAGFNGGFEVSMNLHFVNGHKLSYHTPENNGKFFAPDWTKGAFDSDFSLIAESQVNDEIDVTIFSTLVEQFLWSVGAGWNRIASNDYVHFMRFLDYEFQLGIGWQT